MTIDTNDRVIEMSNFLEYQSYSNGYSWMQREHIVLINTLIQSSESISDVLNSPKLWNRLGSDIFNMPYVLDMDTYAFVIPELSDLIESDVKRKNNIGMIINALIKTDENNIFFKNSSKFILYNDKIEVVSLEEVKDANITNIVFNLVSVYLLQTFKRGMK